jgi:hypothetical protein
MKATHRTEETEDTDQEDLEEEEEDVVSYNVCVHFSA